MSKDNKKITFEITEESISLVNEISKNMNGKTFHNHYHILYDITNSINKDDLIYLEIGAYAGGSASLMSSNHKISKSYSVDIGYPINKETAINNVLKFKHKDCEYHYFHGSSMDKKIIEEVKSKINYVDILFIDGDHAYNAVLSDFKNYSDLVVKGGYIIFDDYLDNVHSPGVKPAVDSLCETINEEYEIIGSLNYDLLKKTDNPNLNGSNEFILKKK